MRIPSGKIDQKIYFKALDSVDYVTPETGLTGFTVYRSRNGGTATLYTTPTVGELDATNMPGVYALTVDEDTTIAATSDSEEYCVHITKAGMAPVTRTIELYRRDTTSGKTAVVDADGLIDATAVKVGPTGAGTAQTAVNIAALLTTQMTESYAADGVAPTLAQAIFMIQQALTEFAISGTTITIKKLDGSATAATLTIDSATAPTSATRAT